MNNFVRKWGNSAAVRIPASALAAAGLKPDDPVEVREENGRIVIEAVRKAAVDLDALVDAITPQNLHEEIDSSDRQSREAW